MTIFSAGKHDDQVDSTAQALHWIKTGRKPEPGMIAYLDYLLKQRGLSVPPIPGFHT